MRTVLIIVVILALGVGAFALLVPPPRQLDLLDAVWPGEGSGTRIVRDVAFGVHPRLTLNVYADRTAGTAPKPVLVFFHGGGWHGGGKDQYGFAARAYAERGFLVVLPNYRLVPGVRFPVFVQDSAAAIAWAYRNAARYGGDPTRIVTAGHSAGAYNAAMTALDPQWLAAEELPADTIKAVASLSGPYDFYPWTRDSSRDAMGGWQNPRETQPIAFARPDAPPLWLGHGTADTSVRPYNSVNMAAALRGVGAPVVLRLYPEASHNDLIMAVSRVFRGRLPVLEESAAFLLERSKPPSSPPRRRGPQSALR